MNPPSATHYIDIQYAYIITAYLYSNSWSQTTLKNTFNYLLAACVPTRSTTARWWDLLSIPRLKVSGNFSNFTAHSCYLLPWCLPCHYQTWTHKAHSWLHNTQHVQKPVARKSTLMTNGSHKIMYTRRWDELHFHSQRRHISSHGKEQSPLCATMKPLNYFTGEYAVFLSWRSAN